MLEVRGEVYMTNSELLRLNELRAAAGDAAVCQSAELDGRLAQDARLADRRPAPAAVYLARSGRVSRHREKSYLAITQLMKKWGIPVSPHTRSYDSIEQVIEHAERWNDERNSLDFQTDGLVVKVDDLDQRERLGTRSKSPRWTIAFKYEAEQAITRLLGIHVQVGKTGKITPVAELEPVLLAGTTVKRASLHNADELERKDIMDRRCRGDPEGRRDHPAGRAGRDRRTQGNRDAISLSQDVPELRGTRRDGRGTRSIITAPIRRRGVPTSSRNGCAGMPIATRWISKAWARS